MWLLLALGSAFFAALVSVLGKKGLVGVSVTVATAIRSAVALVLAWIVVLATGSAQEIGTLSSTNFWFLIASGVATGLSWLFYFKSLSLGKVTDVVSVDRLSLLFTGLFGILLFGETDNLPVKIVGLLVVVLGTYVLVVKPANQKDSKSSWSWLPWALASMSFAVATTLLAKIGLTNVDSNLATAIRTTVVVILAGSVLGKTNNRESLKTMNARNFFYLACSGLATGASWLCYFGAIKIGEISVIAPIDKLSILFAAALGFWLLGERVSKRELIGLVLIAVGTLILFIKP